jgi:hypothetical protein
LGEAARLVGDADLEMLGHVAPAQHRADGLADCRGAVQRTARGLQCARARDLSKLDRCALKLRQATALVTP